MQSLQRRFVCLGLVLAWAMAPILHLQGHLDEGHQHIHGRVASGIAAERVDRPRLPELSDHAGHRHACEACLDLAHRLGWVQASPGLSLGQDQVASTLGSHQDPAHANVFPYFDHRGPPIQA